MKIFNISLFILLTFSPFNNLYPQYADWEDISNQIPGDSVNNLSDTSVPNRWGALLLLGQDLNFTGVNLAPEFGKCYKPHPL